MNLEKWSDHDNFFFFGKPVKSRKNDDFDRDELLLLNPTHQVQLDESYRYFETTCKIKETGHFDKVELIFHDEFFMNTCPPSK